MCLFIYERNVRFLMSKDVKIGVNWHLRFRMEIEKLKNEKMLLEIDNSILKRKLKK